MKTRGEMFCTFAGMNVTSTQNFVALQLCEI